MLNLESEIDSVVVFQSGAQVSRRASLPADLALPARLVLKGLPPCLLDSSIVASVVGSSGAVVAEAIVGPHIDQDESADGARLKALRKQRDDLFLERRVIDEDIERLSSLEVRSRPDGKDGEPPPSVSVEARLSLLRYRTDELETIRQRRREIEKASADLDEEEEDLKRASRRECRVSKQVELHLQGQGPLTNETVLMLSYRVPGARWTPTYQLKFDPLLSQVEAQLRVLVAQDTGEDWADVRLSVTTTHAEQNTELEELASLRIGKSQPPPPSSKWKAPPSDTQALFSDFDRKLGEEGGFIPHDLSAPQTPSTLASGLSESSNDSSQICDQVDLGMMAGSARAAGALLPIDAIQSVPQESVSESAKRMSAPLKKRKSKASFFAGSSPASVMSRDKSIAPGTGGAALEDNFLLLEEEAPTEVRILDPSTREYARLVMPSALQPSRGRLQVQSLTEQIRRVAIRAAMDVKELVRQVHGSIQRAERVGSIPWPPGHSGPRWPGKEPFDLHFHSQGLCRVPSDGAFHGQLLKEFTLPVNSRFVTVPRETQQVFRSVEMESPDVLPPGTADIYVGGDFLLSGTVDGAAPGGKLRLALGVEERIKVARNTRFAESVSGVVSKTRRFEHVIEIELVNNLPREANIEVRERLPQPEKLEKDVEVKVDSSKPEWESFDSEDSPEITDARRWVVSLKAGQKTTLEAQYTIVVPKKFELQGGNRRD